MTDLNHIHAQKEAAVTEPAVSADIKLPADLETIRDLFISTNQKKRDAQAEARNALYDLMHDAADKEAALDEANEKAVAALVRRLAVTEELLRQERAARAELQATVDAFSNAARLALTGLDDGSDKVAGRVQEIATHERLYREQYEHPEPPPPPADSGTPSASVDPVEDDIAQTVAREFGQPRQLAAARRRTDFEIPAFLRQGRETIPSAMPVPRSSAPPTLTAISRVLRLGKVVLTGAAANHIGPRAA